MWNKYIIAKNLSEVIGLLDKYAGKTKIIAGGTDLILEFERNIHPLIEVIIDVSCIEGMDKIILDKDGYIHLGPLVTNSHCVKSKLINESARCLAEACVRVGSPQIRNRATIAGNVITASPANDTIPALMVLDATIVVTSISGTREIPIKDFYRGVRKTTIDLREMVTDIYFKKYAENTRSSFYKHSLRKAQAISVLNAAVLVSINGDLIQEAKIAIGSMAPTVFRARNAEAFIKDKVLTSEIIKQTSLLAAESTFPITDIRSSDAYRKKVVAVAVKRALTHAIESFNNTQSNVIPVTLWGTTKSTYQPLTGLKFEADEETPIQLKINGKEFKISGFLTKTLLDLIRDGAKLSGTKEGCAEGECGACTVFMDGVAVLACLVPAVRANGTEIITVEGISSGTHLHKVQDAFIEQGAVQCGYCTPGFVMSAVKLLEENSHPTKDEIKMAISGNLCRCTGYYNIVSAIEKAVLRE